MNAGNTGPWEAGELTDLAVTLASIIEVLSFKLGSLVPPKAFMSNIELGREYQKL
jgi:hypothetical protein